MALFRNTGELESGQIGRNHPEPVSESRDQLAVLNRRRRKAMQQQHTGAPGGQASR
jgi:hypothetical protein